ncbi:MAG: hypothetical protein GEU98_14085 [Pseudonocardiaceae bacterium]|nr:hypothetical protein [Pseudonocardiaceae bacterium]
MFELPFPAFDFLWEDLHLGPKPFPLEIPSHGDTMTERARLREAVYANLTERQLVHNGRLEPEVEDTLRLVARPSICVDAVANLDLGGETPLRALGASSGRYAVLVVQRELVVEFRPVRDTALISSLVELIPATRQGPGQPVSLPSSAIAGQSDQSGQSGRSRQGGQHHRDESGPIVTRARDSTAQYRGQLHQLNKIQEQRVLRAGQFGVSTAGSSGRPKRIGGLSWFATDEGQYTTGITRSSDGADWVTVTPCDAARLTQQIGQLLAHARS